MVLNDYSKIGEKLYSETLSNGLAVYVLDKPGYEKSYAFFATKYGGADRRFKLGDIWTDTPAGVAHFLEHKMFDTPDGGNALAELSANGASPNAFTGSAMTAYHFESTDGFYQNLETLLRFVSVPYFTEESVAKEQGIIGQEIHMMEDHPGFAVYYNLLRCLYSNNPIRDSVAGTVESISQITADTLYGCHKVFYNPSNMVLCAAGDIDPERVVSAAQKILPAEPGETPARDYGEAETLYPISERSIVAMEVAAPLFVAGLKLTPAGSGTELLRQRIAGNLALACMFGRSSPFYVKHYADGLLNDDFSVEIDYAAGTATFMADGESRDPSQVFAEISAELGKVSSQGLDLALFDRLKKAAYGNRIRALGAFDAQCRALADGHFNNYCPLDAFDILNGIGIEEVNGFVRDNLKAERLALSVVEPGGKETV